MNKWIMIIFMVVLIVLLVAEVLSAQTPPMLPGSPEQAPVSGGLAILAASGGAYAWLKLRRGRM
jgi:ABC-type transport system involved in multi-copper enzyme maturation permease subunit